MGRLVCSMMDFEEEQFSDVFNGVSAYQYIDPEEYYWAGEEDEEEFLVADWNGC